ncbi:GH1 family beta-glucosidase [Microlunatus soli]|uniref:Beta-glucosidase n=1 Tax=Microlunatus soli TaxID=630515 RepID=A0A1H1NK27_9ACTN|nr:GH1 family beta-glucosidase [Microlunatus soli]SDR99210.1 broad-specificity cellobiase [Microlunatus soli]
MNTSDDTLAGPRLPRDFVIGAATASYQVEGATTEDGRGRSIWDTFAGTPGTIADGTTGDVADDHYHRYADDVALMADLGLDAYRFSIAWPRIQPGGTGRALSAGIDFYRRLAESLLQKGITPWATLYHWDLPQALEDRGGWLDPDTANRFADYAAAVQDGLGDLITHWITLNEPWCAAFLGYASGVHAPGKQLGSEAAHAAHHLLRGHGLASQVLRRDAAARVGVTLNLYSVRPASSAPDDVDAARRIDGLQNRFFLEPVLRGSYPEDVLTDLGETAWFAERTGDLTSIAAPLDFLGINYYSRHTTTTTDRPARPSAYPGSEQVTMVATGAATTEMGWEIHPDGMVDVLRQAAAMAPELPLYITENGSAWPDAPSADGAFDDVERRRYLHDHLAACRQAIDAGIDLRGYFIWTLTDNWEWAFGQSRRFGLIHVDYDTQRRTVKHSGEWLRSFLATR